MAAVAVEPPEATVGRHYHAVGYAAAATGGAEAVRAVAGVGVDPGS